MTAKAHEISNELIQEILRGRYRAKERLPSERDLAVRFGVSRSVTREAMKKLEQIGLAEIQPGGTRVKSTSEASLDVIGHMLTKEGCDQKLVEQVIVVLITLMKLAAEEMVEEGDNGLLCALAKTLDAEPLGCQEYEERCRHLFRATLEGSNNLPLRIIIRTLFELCDTSKSAIEQHSELFQSAFRDFARDLDNKRNERSASLDSSS